MYFYMLAAAAFLVGVICNSILRSGVNELTSNAENMETADNGFFRQMKLKYENTIKNGREINNMEAFAEKFLQKYRLRGFKLSSFEKGSSFAAGMCMIFGIAGAMMDKSHVVEYVLVGFLAMYVIVGTRKMIDVQGKTKTVVVDIVDYFENRFYAAAKEDVVKEPEKPAEKVEKKACEPEVRFTKEEKKIIDEILREYLG